MRTEHIDGTEHCRQEKQLVALAATQLVRSELPVGTSAIKNDNVLGKTVSHLWPKIYGRCYLFGGRELGIGSGQTCEESEGPFDAKDQDIIKANNFEKSRQLRTQPATA